MTAEIINLKRFRKQREREAHEEQAAGNRARFGRTRVEKEREAASEDLRQRLLDGARRASAERDTAQSPDVDRGAADCTKPDPEAAR